jgi:hypothetical protein
MLKGLRRRHYWPVLAILLSCAIIAQPAGIALAGTIGTISGTVHDTSGATVSGVAVTAVSASARYTAHTDAHGYYVMTGVSPDTYTVSFQHSGYEPQDVQGVVVFADQSVTVNAALTKSLKTIASVTSRSSAGAFQPSQTADTYSVNTAAIQAIQGNPLNISEKNLIRSLPGASYSNSDVPSIRGGRTNNVDYEVDGVPYVNPYTNGNVNFFTMPSFAYQSVQLSPGNEDASFGNSGVGTINAVLATGSYPGSLDASLAVGGPGFDHALALGWSAAAPNRRWSNLMSYTAENTAPRYGGNIETNSTLNGSYGAPQLIENRDFTNNFLYNFGGGDRYQLQYFTDIGFNRIAGGYGQDILSYNANLHNAPGYAVNGPMQFGSAAPEWITYFSSDRNPAPTDCGVPACASTASAFYWFWGQTGSPSSAQAADACYQGDWDGITLQQFQQMAPLYPGQTSPNETLAQASGRPDYQEFDTNSTQKLQFNYRPDSRTIAQFSYYNTSADNIGDSISIYPFDSGDVWASEGGYQHAWSLDVTRQLSDKNQLKFGGTDIYKNPQLQTISPMTSWFNPLFNGNMEQFDFINPNNTAPGMGVCGSGQKVGSFTDSSGPFTAPYAIPGMIFFPNTYLVNEQQQALYPGIPSGQQGVYSGPQVPADTPACGYLYQFFPGVTQLQMPAAENGNVVHPTGGGLYVSDTWQPNARLKADVGLRVDTQHNHYPAPGVAKDCTTEYLPLTWGVTPVILGGSAGSYTNSNGGNFDPISGMFLSSGTLTIDPTTGEATNGSPMGPGNCPTATFLPVTSDQNRPVVFEPRLALSYLIGRDDDLRFDYGRTVRFPDYVFTDSVENPAPYAAFYNIPAHMNTDFIAPMWWSLTGPYTPYAVGLQSNPTLAAEAANNYYSANGIPTTCGMTDFGLAVPCTNYGEQLYWTGFNGDFGKPLFPLAPIIYNNFDFSWEHQLGGGFAFKVTPWSRRAYNLDVSTQIENTNQPTGVNASGQNAYHEYGLISNNGIEIAKGLEFYLTKSTPWHGLTGMLSATFQSVKQNIDPANVPAGLGGDLSGSVNNETTGAQSLASAAFNKLYNVDYVTPFSSALALQWQAPTGGWRIQTEWEYDAGYPYGQGYNVVQLYAGVPHILPASSDCTGSSVAYNDPTNPGSCFSPNIAATRGTNEGSFANQVFTHPNLTAELTVEKTIGQGRLGFTVLNLFNEVYTGPTIPNGIDFGQTGPRLSTAALNDQGVNFGSNGSYPTSGMTLNPIYQPVATGIAGPLTGVGLYGNVNAAAASFLCATCAYIHLPNGEGRSYYVYYQFRMGGR